MFSIICVYQFAIFQFSFGEEVGGGGEITVEGEVSFGVRAGVVVEVVAGAVEVLAFEVSLVATLEGEEVGFVQMVARLMM